MNTPDDPPHLSPSGEADRDQHGGVRERLARLEAQPLVEHAASYVQLHDELLADLQRGDHGDE